MGGEDFGADSPLGAQPAQILAERLIGREIVAQVGQPGMPGPDAVRQSQRLVERKMRMVRAIPYGVERQMLQPAQFDQLLIREPAHVRDIRDAAEPESEHRHVVVVAADRNDFDAVSAHSPHQPAERRIFHPFRLPEEFSGSCQRSVSQTIPVADIMHPDQFPRFRFRIEDERPLVDQVDVPFRSAGIFFFGERITVFRLQRPEDFRFAVDFDGASAGVVEGTDIIQPSRMVLMIVSQENGVGVADACPEHLAPEIRSDVDEDAQPAIFDENRGAETLVPRIGG